MPRRFIALSFPFHCRVLVDETAMLASFVHPFFLLGRLPFHMVSFLSLVTLDLRKSLKFVNT